MKRRRLFRNLVLTNGKRIKFRASKHPEYWNVTPGEPLPRRMSATQSIYGEYYEPVLPQPTFEDARLTITRIEGKGFAATDRG